MTIRPLADRVVIKAVEAEETAGVSWPTAASVRISAVCVRLARRAKSDSGTRTIISIAVASASVV